MGALVYGCGGIVIGDGWLRVLGSGCERMKRGIYRFSLGKSFSEAGPMRRYLLVADRRYFGRIFRDKRRRL